MNPSDLMRADNRANFTAADAYLACLESAELEDEAVESHAAALWEEHGLRVDLLETIGLGQRDKLIAALQADDYRRFARLMNDAGYEEAAADLERKRADDELDHGMNLWEERNA